MFAFRYAYLTAIFIMFVVWFLLFFRRKDLRHEMLIMSVLSWVWIGVAYLMFSPYIADTVWVPDTVFRIYKGVCLEDAIYTFFFGGIAAVLYEEVLGKRHFKKFRKENNFIHYALFPIMLFLVTFVGINIFNINFFYTTYIGFLLSALLIFFMRKDLLWHAILSGVFLSILYFTVVAFIFVPLFPGIVQRWYHLSHLSNILVSGVPLEEIMWAFFYGLFIGPCYEFILGLKDRK
jgi:hypothetical protein